MVFIALSGTNNPAHTAKVALERVSSTTVFELVQYSQGRTAGREVENIAAEIPNTTKLLDRAFSREATEERLNNYNIIHFATHGAFVPGQPEESFILFDNGELVMGNGFALDNYRLPITDYPLLF